MHSEAAKFRVKLPTWMVYVLPEVQLSPLSVCARAQLCKRPTDGFFEVYIEDQKASQDRQSPSHRQKYFHLHKLTFSIY